MFILVCGRRKIKLRHEVNLKNLRGFNLPHNNKFSKLQLTLPVEKEGDIKRTLSYLYSIPMATLLP